ncbi:MAG: hypothetical protein NC548_44920 [Lachnospiraceae bacterium]|nr:hypothetical protein [Lachnospiraceae bacterium]MCM1232195.1 hypothetical protein [Ruminococcus flavefaciens]
MVNAVNVPAQVVPVNGTVLFGSTRILTGCSVRHEQGSGRFVALKPGIYKVSFSGNVSVTAAGAAALVLTQEGEEVAGSRMTATLAAASPENISTTVLIRVYCDCCVSLGVRNVSATEVTLDNANFVITREC